MNGKPYSNMSRNELLNELKQKNKMISMYKDGMEKMHHYSNKNNELWSNLNHDLEKHNTSILRLSLVESIFFLGVIVLYQQDYTSFVSIILYTSIIHSMFLLFKTFMKK